MSSSIIQARKLSEIKEDYLIYHYTSPDVFVKILQDGLWATHTDFLNDDMEIKHGERLAELVFSAEPLKTVHKDIRKSLNNLDVYITCFAKEPDSLYQWKAYTPHGGFAIGFSRKELFEAANSKLLQEGTEERKMLDMHKAFATYNEISSEKSQFFFLEKCIYSPELIVKEMVDEVKNTAIQAPGMFDVASRELKRKYGILEVMDNFAFIPILKLLCCMAKNKTFHIESEERLICIGDKSLRKKVELIGNKPRIKIPCDPEDLRKMIKTVKVSPHGNRMRNFAFAEIFRDKYNLDFKIEHSYSSSNGE